MSPKCQSSWYESSALFDVNNNYNCNKFFASPLPTSKMSLNFKLKQFKQFKLYGVSNRKLWKLILLKL